MRILVLLLAVVFVCFFAVFAVHADSPLQQEVKASLESGGSFPFSAQANSHMHDVYQVLTGARVLTALLVVALLWLLPSLSALHLRVAGGLLVALPLLAALLPWDVLFTGLHLVLFPQGNWRFPADSLLIQTYPMQFFVEYAVSWAALVVVAGVLLLVGARYWERFRTALA